MKRYLVFSLLCIAALATHAQVTAYLSDVGPKTNIRNKPNGKIVMSLNSQVSYAFLLTSPVNGWWEVTDIWNEENDNDPSAQLKGTNTREYWIHYSVIAVSTANYGGQRLSLRSSPNAKAKEVFSFTEELKLRPIDYNKNGWVKVKCESNGKEGWIEAEWLCGNSLTNCS